MPTSNAGVKWSPSPACALNKATAMSYVTHIESSAGRDLPIDEPCTALPDEMLAVRYDLARIKREVSPRDIAAGPASLWRYAPLLPLSPLQTAVSLNEGYTPLLGT